MPLETETRKPGIVGMFDWDFQDDLRRQFKQFWFLARHLNDQWKNVKGRSFYTFPPKLEDLVCQTDMRRIANNGAIWLLIACIADQLRIPDAKPWLCFPRRSKDRNR